MSNGTRDEILLYIGKRIPQINNQILIRPEEVLGPGIGINFEDIGIGVQALEKALEKDESLLIQHDEQVGSFLKRVLAETLLLIRGKKYKTEDDYFPDIKEIIA